jgi:hypothetical protein
MRLVSFRVRPDDMKAALGPYIRRLFRRIVDTSDQPTEVSPLPSISPAQARQSTSSRATGRPLWVVGVHSRHVGRFCGRRTSQSRDSKWNQLRKTELLHARPDRTSWRTYRRRRGFSCLSVPCYRRAFSWGRGCTTRAPQVTSGYAAFRNVKPTTPSRELTECHNILRSDGALLRSSV